MSIPQPGEYRLRNVKYPNQMFDLKGGSATAGTPIVGYANNNNTHNMIWTLQVVDENSQLVRLINVASGTFAQRAESGSGIIGSPNPHMFKIVPRKDVGEFSIQTTGKDMACHLANRDNYTQVTLQKINNDEQAQGWIFAPA